VPEATIDKDRHLVRWWEGEIGPAGQALFLYACSELAENEKGRR